MVITDIIQCILSLVACGLAWIIPQRIMWEQTYVALVAEYRSCEFGAAVQGIIEFFVNDCKNNPDKVREMYQKRFKKDFGTNQTSLDECLCSSSAVNLTKLSPEQCLHYQRRLLAQFFYQLDLCARSRYIGKKRVRRDYTQGEANIVRILILMDKAIDDDRRNGENVLWKDISCDYRVRCSKNEKGMNSYLSDIYRVLQTSKRHMEVKW